MTSRSRTAHNTDQWPDFDAIYLGDEPLDAAYLDGVVWPVVVVEEEP